MLLARRWTWIDKVSPMAVLYIIGLLVANLTPWIRQPGLLDTNNLIGSVCIPLSIPLMLMSCSLSRVSFDNTFKAFLCGFGAILLVTVAGFFLFRHHTDPTQFAKISAVAVGIYTGGIPNMGAIAQGVGMDNTTYLYITSYDLIVTGLYLVFVICFGKQFRAGTQDFCLGCMLGGASDASSGTHHTLDKVLLQFSGLQQRKRLFALVASGTGKQRNVGGILPHLLHYFQNRFGYTAASRKILSEN